MISPQTGISLPIWRDKITAKIAAAQAGQRAATARLSAEQITLAVDIAEKLYLCRESARNLQLVQQHLIPKAKMALDVGRSSYLVGKVDFFSLSDMQRQLLQFQLMEVDARIQRELALAELSLLVIGQMPEGAPVVEKK